jgi:hypothetical protein
MRRLCLVFLLLLWPALGWAQKLHLQLDSEEVYANLPFVLSVVAQGFDENPQPTLSKLNLPGCRVTPIGVTPNVSSMVQIFNGQRSETRDVTFVFRFRIEAPQAGEYKVPALVAEQGSKKAESQPARFTVRAVDDTKDMQVRLILPERPLWVGETVDGALEWYLRREVGNRAFAVPLFDQDDWVEVEAPPGQPRLAGFSAGSRQLELPYKQDKVNFEGADYTRFRFEFRLTPTRAGVLTPQAARIVAALNVGSGRDFFGFPSPELRLFQAVSKPIHLDIRPLPQAGRPESFKNAVGAAFSMDVQAGRTVVRVGDPIELRILLRGNGRLAGLILPSLSSMGLSEAHFAMTEEAPAGEVLDDGKGKLFRVSVRLRSTEAKEIPSLSFSYFDPNQGKFQTVRSQPIALNVKGSAVVGAQDVVDATGKGQAGPTLNKGQAAPKSATAAEPVLPLVGADLALSDEQKTWRRASSMRDVLPWLIALYGASLALLLTYGARRRNHAERQREAETQRALRALQKELQAAAKDAAHDAAPRLCAALRALRKELGQEPGAASALLERLETESYSRDAASRPLDAALRAEVESLAKSWLKAGRPARSPSEGSAKATLGLLLPLGFGVAVALSTATAPVFAQDSAAEQKLARARSSYKDALAQTDRDRRANGFTEAEQLLRELATAYPDRPQLLCDWGNAALLAQEPGRSLLAFRRALRLDPTLPRARRNLSFLREHLPEWLPRPHSGAVDSLLFWAELLAAPQRQVLLAAAALCSVALLIPWSSRRRRLLRALSALPMLVALAMALSLIVEHDSTRDAVVVMTGATLRSADSLGAPPALGHPLPAGTEVTVSEVRGEWARITLADGQNGWLASSSIENL